MEFIPLEKGQKTGKKDLNAKESVTNKKNNKKNKLKNKLQLKAKTKKNTKNKFRQNLVEKKKSKLSNKKKKKLQKTQEDDHDSDEEAVAEDEDVEMKEEGLDLAEENSSEEEETDDSNDESAAADKAKEEKWKEMDEQKKNRLFVKMKRKIVQESQVKCLHPDIRKVIFPRKNNSRWCWAVFASEERAAEAMKTLIKNPDVFVSKPNSRFRVEEKRQKKMVSRQRKAETRKKLQEMWS